MKTNYFVMFALATFVGSVAALFVWTLVVKNQVSAQLATTTAANPILGALTNL